ncbi:MAG: FHA domain-containing protein [Myxococcales bacterium]|nr:FHA domain-containing protein [Myxococcales bacterium]
MRRLIHSPACLRVTSGPLQGTVLALQDRFLIGRSPQADLQLLDERASPAHAEIVATPEGSYWLVDQGSAHGTYIDDRAVREQRLGPSTAFHVAGSTFVLETQAPRAKTQEATFVISSPDPSAEGTARRTLHRIVARNDAGLLYGGNAIEDIAEFRSLTVRKARDELVDAEALARLEALSYRLQLPLRLADGAQRRLYARLSISVPAAVRRPSGEEIAVTTVDMGAEGAQLLAYGHDLQRGEHLWLIVHLVSGASISSLVLAGRITWTSVNHLGLAFSSPSQPAHHRAPSHPEPAGSPTRAEHQAHRSPSILEAHGRPSTAG